MNDASARDSRPAGAAPNALAIVMKGYPRLSETFIAQELLTLQRHGLPFTIYSLRQPTDDRVHPVHREIKAPVRYLPEYLYQAPWRVIRGWWRVTSNPAWRDGYRRARAIWWRDLKRDRTPNRIRRWGQALVLAAELPEETRHIYAHFLHTPGSVARYAAAMRGLAWSVSAHAKDIYTIPTWEKAEKIADMAWLVTCTAANVDHLRQIAGEAASKVGLLYHGLDLGRFGNFERPPSAADGSADKSAVRLLSVGRAVPKKGYEGMLEALALLPAGLNWHLTHIGGGELRKTLEARSQALGLGHKVEWNGARTQDEVLAAYRAADLFVLAPRITGNGDRDGLPNVLMEAQSQGLAVVSTDISGVPELIRSGDNGLLVPADDPGALAAAIAALIADPARRDALGRAGAARVRATFDHDRATAGLADRLLRDISAGGERVAP